MLMGSPFARWATGDRTPARPRAETPIRCRSTTSACGWVPVGSVAVLPDLRQMRYFTEVVRERNFTRAAQNLHVAQQALSQQVKALENLLGVTLLERTTRR